MGERASQNEPAWWRALAWAVAHRRKLIAGAVVLLPLVARYAPGFPADEVLSALRAYLGAA